MNEEETMAMAVAETAVATTMRWRMKKKDEEEDRGGEEEEWLTGWPQRTWSKPNLPVLPLATTTTYRTITCNQSISGLQLHLSLFSFLSFFLFYLMHRVRQNSGILCVFSASSTDVIVFHMAKRFSPRKFC